MLMKSFLVAAFAAIAIAAPAPHEEADLEERAPSPTVTIKNGTVIGSSSKGIDSFSGIPFAQPPLGDLRLRPARTINETFPTFTATASAKACPWFVGQYNIQASVLGSVLPFILDGPIGATALDTSEDCLTITVQRPAGISSNAKLPVLFWIFGGGFEVGDSAMYDGSNFIQKSIALGEPIVYVAVNYRLGGYGFLGGSDLANERSEFGETSTNLGLRDQRKGLQWVQENIAAFGGDPDKVTIWGESAGSISVCDHLIINGGDNTYNGKPLFRAAMMDSGTIVPAENTSSLSPQAIYDTVVKNANCDTASDKLACLRSLSTTEFSYAADSVPWIFSYQSLDLSYVPRPDAGDNFFAESPEIPFLNGNFAKVPVIVGDQEDEGTLFSLVQSNDTTAADVITYLASYFPTNPNATELVTGLMANYPNDPSGGQPAGSPFGTGSQNNIYPQFKRLAAVLGDITFTLTRRLFLTALAYHNVKSYSYLSTYFYGSSILGTFHGSDLLYIFSGNNNTIVNSIQGYYIGFIASEDPNEFVNSGKQDTGVLINWPEYTLEAPVLLNFSKTVNDYTNDTFRQDAANYLFSHPSSFRV